MSAKDFNLEWHEVICVAHALLDTDELPPPPEFFEPRCANVGLQVAYIAASLIGLGMAAVAPRRVTIPTLAELCDPEGQTFEFVRDVRAEVGRYLGETVFYPSDVREALLLLSCLMEDARDRLDRLPWRLKRPRADKRVSEFFEQEGRLAQVKPEDLEAVWHPDAKRREEVIGSVRARLLATSVDEVTADIYAARLRRAVERFEKAAKH